MAELDLEAVAGTVESASNLGFHSGFKGSKGPVWKYFKFELDSRGQAVDVNRVVCLLCPRHAKRVAYSKTPTNLKQHLQSKHPEQYSELLTSEEQTKQLKQSSIEVFGQCSGTSSRPYPASKGKEISKKIAEMIAFDMLPYSFVEGQGFQRLIGYLAPGYKIPSRVYFSRTEVPKLYNDVKSKITPQLSSAVSVGYTTDIWSSIANDSYISVTAHFVTFDFEQKSYILATQNMPERHTGVHIEERLLQLLSEWGLEKASGTCIAVTTDNASNMVAAFGGSKWKHIHCVAHTLNLCVEDGLKKPEVQKVLGRCRNIVSFFHRSPLATTQLREKQKELQIPCVSLKQAVATRWNSTVEMVKRLVEQEAAVTSVLATLGKRELQPSASEWESMEELVPVLEPFLEATKLLSYERQPSVSVVEPVLAFLLQKLQATDGRQKHVAKVVAADLKKAIQTRLADCDDTDLRRIASFLDPRFKDLAFLPESDQQLVIEEVAHMALEYTPSRSEGTAETQESTQTSVAKKRKLSEFEAFLAAKQPNRLSKETAVAEEIAHYRRVVRMPLNTNAYSWWAENKKQFPTLSQLARRLLALPATSVPSERAFSKAGHIVRRRRARLSPSNVDKLVFLSHNYRQLMPGEPLCFIVQTESDSDSEDEL